MFNYELEQSIKEEYLQVCWNLTWWIRINFNKNTNILLERYEVLGEFIASNAVFAWPEWTAGDKQQAAFEGGEWQK